MPAAQLDSLRAFVAARPATRPGAPRGAATATVVVVGSGRGGTGASVAAALLALSAAAAGRRALLVDLDEQVGPQRFLLGVAPAHALPALRAGLAPEELLAPVSATLSLLACCAGGGDAPPAPAERRALLRRASSTFARHDLVVVDAGSRLEGVRAGLDVARAAADAAAHAGGNLAVRLLVVTGSDPIALAASYALVKGVAAADDPARAPLAVDVLASRLDEDEARHAFEHVEAAARQFLQQPLRFAGALPDDATLAVALKAGMPLQDAAAGSPAAVAMQAVAARLAAPAGPSPAASAARGARPTTPRASTAAASHAHPGSLPGSAR